jgi:predicted ATP-grasp superfamily ATP-dependent carboligase
MAGIACVAVAPSGDPVRYSRFTHAFIERPERPEADDLVKGLRAFAQSPRARPVLYYQDDEHLMLVSRHRRALGEFARYVLPDEQLVEDLVDKVRFQSLAERLELPVPRSRRLSPNNDLADLGDLAFPLVLKPSTRQNLGRLQYEGKALAVESREAFMRLWPQLAAAGIELIAQELITGPEASVESYHAYVDSHGRVAGEFTGAKLRTRPSAMGFSTAVRTTCAKDLLHAGRDVVERVCFRGVLKADYKRDAQGCLHLLEVNPRFSLWHHLGAAAGVNLLGARLRQGLASNIT